MSPTINSPTHASTALTREPHITLPTRSTLVLMVVAVLLVAGGWAMTVSVGKLDAAVFTSGMLGIGLVGVLSIAGVLIMTPWKPRTMADWMTMWMGATVFRVLVTPIAAFLIYSASSSVLAAKPLALAVALTYLVTLFLEAAVVSQHLKRTLDGAGGAPATIGPASNGTIRS